MTPSAAPTHGDSSGSLRRNRPSAMAQDKAFKPYISPLLSAIVYRLGQSVFLPYYFKSVTVEGQENMPTEGAVILAPMHRSRWDAFMVPNVGGRFAIGREVHFMVTTDEMTGIQGWVIRRMGGFPVNTKKPSRDSLRNAINLLKAEKEIAIFPEGNIFKDGKVHRLKAGLSRMAMQAASDELNVKVVPIALYYDQPDVPWGTNAIIRVGKPLETDSYKDLSGREAAKRLNQDLTVALEAFQADFNAAEAVEAVGESV